VRLLQEGETLRGTYEVERFLGEGAFAEVYRVKHRFLGRQAMKVFKQSGITLDETTALLGEAILLSRLGHPNIIRVFDAGLVESRAGEVGYFTMEYVAGGSLEQFWRSHGPRFVPVETVVEIGRQVCRGLVAAHSESPPIIHRDIKPQNIMVGYEVDGLRARISDFGLAKRANPMTLLVSARGTRCFKPPEAFRDYCGDSCAGDVWAVGATLYLMLTDRLPFEVPEEIGEMDPRCFEQPPVAPRRLNVDINEALEQIVLKALALNVHERYPTARELLQDLERWQPGEATAMKASSTLTAKDALGRHSPPDEQWARDRVREALALAREQGLLNEAADLMEDTFKRWPALRDQYENQVRLWRRGIFM
jgi:serine/threonine-protein kinase